MRLNHPAPKRRVSRRRVVAHRAGTAWRANDPTYGRGTACSRPVSRAMISACLASRQLHKIELLPFVIIRRFGAKPDKKIVDRSSGKSEFMEDTLHGNSDGMVVGIDRFWVVRAAGWAEWLSGGEKGFDGFVSENEQRGHRPQTGW